MDEDSLRKAKWDLVFERDSAWTTGCMNARELNHFEQLKKILFGDDMVGELAE